MTRLSEKRDATRGQPKFWLWGCGLAASTAAIGLTVFAQSYFSLVADETVLAWIGKQAALGRRPYGDFFSFLPPGVIYGLAAFFKLVGPSLGALRLLTVLWLILVALCLFVLIARSGLPASWSALAAFTTASIFLPFWPVPSHHWFACGFGLMGLVLIWRESAGSLRWFAGGMLIALSGLCLQTDGVFFLVLAALLWLTQDRRDRREALAAAAGLLLPVVLAALLLAFSGTLKEAFEDVVVFPLRYYRQGGGFNDVSALGSIEAFLRSYWTGRLSPRFLATSSLQFVTLALPALAALLPITFLPKMIAERRLDRRWLVGAAGPAWCFALYLCGRADWTHLVLWSPLLVLLLLSSVRWGEERWRPRLLKVWLIFALAVSALRWPMVWLHHPPSARSVLSIDASVSRQIRGDLLGLLPGALERRLPVTVLGVWGSRVYFYWTVDPPPLDVVMPPSSRYNAPGDYAVMASFLTSHGIPYVVMFTSDAGQFLQQPSPLQKVLRDSYLPFKTEAGLTILKRKDP